MLLEWENNSGKLQIISRKFQNSGKFQNNAINDVKQISLSHVIKLQIGFYPFLVLSYKTKTRNVFAHVHIRSCSLIVPYIMTTYTFV